VREIIVQIGEVSKHRGPGTEPDGKRSMKGAMVLSHSETLDMPG